MDNSHGQYENGKEIRFKVYNTTTPPTSQPQSIVANEKEIFNFSHNTSDFINDIKAQELNQGLPKNAEQNNEEDELYLTNDQLDELFEVKIKVLGVGGGGSNAINYMFTKNLKNVDLICANTDIKHLRTMEAKKVPLGLNITKGFGAGADPNIGKKAAEESQETITKIVKNANMLFLTTCLGGGTGTGAAPVIAKIAKELDILTVAVVTLPFAFEGKTRMQNALEGLKKLEICVDSIIIIHNEKLLKISDRAHTLTLENSFSEVNKILYNAVKGITDVITETGIINPDFRDIQTIMKEPGMAIMGLSEINEYSHYKKAVEQALKSPLLNDIDISQVKGLLVNITSGRDIPMEIVNQTMRDINFRAANQQDAGKKVIWGHVYNDAYEGKMTIAIIASGLKNQDKYIYLSSSESYEQMLEEQKKQENSENFTIKTNNEEADVLTIKNKFNFVDINQTDFNKKAGISMSNNSKHKPEITDLPFFRNFDKNHNNMRNNTMGNKSNNTIDELDIPAFIRKSAS